MRNNLMELAVAYQNATENTKYIFSEQVDYALRNVREHLRYMLNGVYGASELRVMFSEQAFDAFFSGAVERTLDRFDCEKVRNQDVSVKAYFTKSLSGMIKDEICRMNGVSKRYVNLLIALKKANLDIWNDHDIPEIQFFLADDSKNPYDLIIKMRQEFTANMPAGTRRQFTAKQIRDFVSETLCVSKYYADIAIRLYRDQVNIWNDSAVAYMSNGLGYKHPETALNRLRNVIDQERYDYLVSYLNYCEIPSVETNSDAVIIDFDLPNVVKKNNKKFA